MPYQCIDYKLKTTGESLHIPLGKCQTFSVDEPLSDDETVNFISVSLKVFTEPTLSKQKARSPSFQVIDEKGQVASEINGYFYLFVNGHLWREITALKDGLLAEIDLVQNYGRDSRRYASIPFNNCVTPKKTIALNSEGDDLTDATVNIAYSPIQWSWQYITSLGGLHKNDPRHKAAKKPTFCHNLADAKKLLNNRCQEIDLDKAQQEKVVYVQDPIGIAFDLLNKCQVNYLTVQAENTKLTQKKHFDSGVLAYQSLFSNDLHQTTKVDGYFFPSKHSFKPIKIKKTVYKDRGDAAKFLRSGAKNIDKAYLEEYLSSEVLEKSLNELPENQQRLYDFLADKPKKSSSKPSEYITLEHALKDLVTLEGVDYLLGFKWLADVFNIMALDADSIGCFRPWKNRLPKEQTRLQNEKKAKQSALAFIEDALTAQHWLTDYFAPKADLYDLTIPGHNPSTESEINDGSGLFRYETFQEIHEKIAKEKRADEHSLANKEFKSYLGAANSCIGYLTGAWGRLSSQYKSGGKFEVQTVKIRNLMVITNKATGVADFSDIHIKKAGTAVGNNATIISITNYKRVEVNRAQRRALVKISTKRPPPNAVTITDAKGKVIAAHNPKEFGANQGVMQDSNWVDYNKLMGNYDLLDGEVVAVPKAHRYAMAYNNPDFKLGFTDTVKLKGVKVLERGLPQVMLAFEVFNGAQMLDRFKSEGKADAKFHLEIWNTVFALAAGSFEVAAFYSKKANILSSSRFKWTFGMKLGRFLMGIGVALGAALSFVDSYQSVKNQDMDAAFLHACGGIVSLIGFGYLAVGLVTTPIGWAIIALGLLITLLAIAFTDNSLEKWAINGPFSRKASARCKGDYEIWDTHPIECYAALSNELFAPSMAMSIQKLGKQSALLNIEVVTPGFIVGQSEVILVVNQISDKGVFSFEKTSRLSYDNWRITQHMNTDDLEKNTEAIKLIGDPQITGFTYSIPISPTFRWGDGLEVDWQAKLQYALDTKTTLPYVDKAEREAWNKDDIPDKAWLIKELEYE